MIIQGIDGFLGSRGGDRAWLLAAPVLAGCSGAQSALAPQGPDARTIASMSWIMFAGAAVILSVVMLLALYAVYRAPQKARPLSANALIMAGGVVFPVLTLTALLVYGVQAMAALRADAGRKRGRPCRSMSPATSGGGRCAIATPRPGHADRRQRAAHTGGVPVALSLRSDDVIHSFWVPTLAGKMDLIPGRTNRTCCRPTEPGVYRGQCAEFCGAQHARMAFVVIAAAADHSTPGWRGWPPRGAAGHRAGAAGPAGVSQRHLRGLPHGARPCGGRRRLRAASAGRT